MTHRPDMGLFLFRIRKFTEEQSFVKDTGLSLTLRVLKTEEDQTLKKNILRIALLAVVCLSVSSSVGAARTDGPGPGGGTCYPYVCGPGMVQSLSR
jgi:hypothetical protein